MPITGPSRLKTEIVKINGNKLNDELCKSIAGVLANGGVVVMPTDTVYGLAVNAFDLKALKKLYKLKGRSYRKPLITMVPDIKALELIVKVPHKAHNLIRKFWPGPLTLILPATHQGQILMGGRKDMGVRIPKNKVVLGILKHCHFPIATTSANPSETGSAKTARAALKFFKDKVDMVIDSGKTLHGRESTVLDMVSFPYTVVREGCIAKDRLLKEVE